MVTASEYLRENVFAGSWYPKGAETLRTDVAGMIRDAGVTSRAWGRMIIVPHAGYVFSGRIAAYGFAAVAGHKPGTVLVMGSPHRVPVAGVAFPLEGRFKMPMGEVAIDQELARALKEAWPKAGEGREAHGPEHCLEIELPFVQHLFPGAKFLPVLVQGNKETMKRWGEALATVLKTRDDVLVVVSTDLSHYPTAATAREVDGATLESWKTLDPEQVQAQDDKTLGRHLANLSCTQCGLDAVLAGLYLAKEMGWDRIEIVKAAHSGEVSGENDRVVGYAAAVVGRDAEAAAGSVPKQEAKPAGTPKPEEREGDRLSPEARKELLRIARTAVEEAVKNNRVPKLDCVLAELSRPQGAFVTLKNQGELRGCIGQFDAEVPLWEVVREMAFSAARKDYRFAANPVTVDELPKIAIEISVLSPLRKVASAEEIVMKRDGVYLKQDGRTGVYLPQVAEETGWSKEEFLSSLCAHKAGLSPVAWKDSRTELFVFTVEKVSE